MKACLLLGIVSCIGVAFGLDGWESNFSAAQKKAADEKKGILIVYRGDGWDPYSYGKPERMFTSERFLNPAKEKYILLEQPYPEKVKGKKGQKETFLLFTDSKGLPYYSVQNGMQNGLQWMLDELHWASQMKTQFETVAKKLNDSTGDDKYRASGEFLELVGSNITDIYAPYKKLKEETMSLDIDDVSGLHKREAQSKVEGTKFMGILATLGVSYLLQNKEGSLTDEQRRERNLAFWSDSLSQSDMPAFFKVLGKYLMLMDKLEDEEVKQLTDDQFKTMLDEHIDHIVKIAPDERLSRWLTSFSKEACVVMRLIESVKEFKETDPAKLVSIFDKQLANDQYSGVAIQLFKQLKATGLLRLGKIDEAIVLLKEARDEEPWLPAASEINEYLNKVTEHRQLIVEILKEKQQGNNARQEELNTILKTNLKLGFQYDS